MVYERGKAVFKPPSSGLCGWFSYGSWFLMCTSCISTLPALMVALTTRAVFSNMRLEAMIGAAVYVLGGTFPWYCTNSVLCGTTTVVYVVALWPVEHSSYARDLGLSSVWSGRPMQFKNSQPTTSNSERYFTLSVVFLLVECTGNQNNIQIVVGRLGWKWIERSVPQLLLLIQKEIKYYTITISWNSTLWEYMITVQCVGISRGTAYCENTITVQCVGISRGIAHCENTITVLCGNIPWNCLLWEYNNCTVWEYPLELRTVRIQYLMLYTFIFINFY